MELLDKFRDFISNLEDTDFYKYLGAFFGVFALLLCLLFYIHYSKVNKYFAELKKADAMRLQTKKLLGDYKAVNAQREKVEDILAKDRNFRIGEAYQTIVQRSGLSSRAELSAPTSGESFSGKTEVVISSHFSSLTMKQVTDLLQAIAQVPQLYVKDLVLKKTPSQTVDVDITVATLVPSSVE